jgi:hypothetical protein
MFFINFANSTLLYDRDYNFIKFFDDYLSEKIALLSILSYICIN